MVKVNPKTVEVISSGCALVLKYPYAEIKEMQIPEEWTEKTDSVVNPFRAGDLLTASYMGSDRIRIAYQVIKTTDKNVILRQIKVENGIPVPNLFVSEKQERRAVKKNRSGEYVANHDDWYLYLYKRNGATVQG